MRTLRLQRNSLLGVRTNDATSVGTKVVEEPSISGRCIWAAALYAVVFSQFNTTRRERQQEKKRMMERGEQQLGKYRLKQALGKGVFADVYPGAQERYRP